jgi:hypothetical protein
MKFIDLQQPPAVCPDSATENLIFDKDKSYAQKQAVNTLAPKIESHATIQLEPSIAVRCLSSIACCSRSSFRHSSPKSFPGETHRKATSACEDTHRLLE